MFSPMTSFMHAFSAHLRALKEGGSLTPALSTKQA